jgi:hypothetical protein
MRITRSMQVLAVSGILAAGLIGAAAQLAPVSASSSIPVKQEACRSPFLSLTGGTGPYHSMGVSVQVNDGSASRYVVAFVSMDADVSPNAEMRLSWSVDGHGVNDYTYGPGNIAENQQFWGTRTVMDVIHLGPGIHTLTPEVRLSGNPSTSGIVARLCAVAEASSS